jgi:hypothetical protein
MKSKIHSPQSQLPDSIINDTLPTFSGSIPSESCLPGMSTPIRRPRGTPDETPITTTEPPSTNCLRTGPSLPQYSESLFHLSIHYLLVETHALATDLPIDYGYTTVIDNRRFIFSRSKKGVTVDWVDLPTTETTTETTTDTTTDTTYDITTDTTTNITTTNIPTQTVLDPDITLADLGEETDTSSDTLITISEMTTELDDIADPAADSGSNTATGVNEVIPAVDPEEITPEKMIPDTGVIKIKSVSFGQCILPPVVESTPDMSVVSQRFVKEVSHTKKKKKKRDVGTFKPTSDVSPDGLELTSMIDNASLSPERIKANADIVSIARRFTETKLLRQLSKTDVYQFQDEGYFRASDILKILDPNSSSYYLM